MKTASISTLREARLVTVEGLVHHFKHAKEGKMFVVVGGCGIVDQGRC